MFEPNSRYATLPTATFVLDGREVQYVRRRLLPDQPQSHTTMSVTVTDGDRLDLIAARAFGDPLAWWLLADHNQAMDPSDLVDEPGRDLQIPMPL